MLNSFIVFFKCVIFAEQEALTASESNTLHIPFNSFSLPILTFHFYLDLMEYNTSREKLLMPEYGRNIQKMVDYIISIEDKEKRQKNAEAIIELMGILNPHLKNVEDFRHKLWDHIFRISDFKIDIESPYPIPSREQLLKKPEPLPYPQRSKKNRHIGKNLSLIIDKALQNEDEQKQKGYINTIAYYMKLAYANWHKEQVQDDMIKEELLLLSEGKLEYVPGDARTMRFNNNGGGTHKKHAPSTQARNKSGHSKSRSGSTSFHNKSQKQNNNRPYGQKNA